MIKFGRPLVALSQQEWIEVVDLLRYAAHNEPDDAHAGMTDERQIHAHTLAAEIVKELELQHDCPDCDMIGGHMNSGHTEPSETCEGCQDLAHRDEEAGQ